MKDLDKQNHSLPHEKTPIEWMRWIPAALLALVFLLFAFISGRIILVPMLVSVALAYLLAPMVTWFEKRGWSRSSSAMLAITTAVLVVILSLIFLLPGLWTQFSRSYSRASELVNDKARVEGMLLKVKEINPQLYDLVKAQFEKYKFALDPGKVAAWVGSWLQRGLFKLVDITASIMDLLLIPFFIYYFLADYREMRDRIDRLIPPRYRVLTTGLISQINTVLSSYVRNQLLIALVMGGMYSAGFLALRVPLGFSIGMLSGLLNFVPYLGTLIGIGLSLLFAALDGAGFGRLAGVLMVFVIVQSVEGYYLTPKLLGSRLNLHPMWVLVGLVIGGNLFGLLGIILAVPIIAVAKVVLGFLEDIYQQTNFYRRTETALLTDQGRLYELSESGSLAASGLILDEEISDRPRRTIITTAELKSRIRESKLSSED
ncbi:MAG TPA: AI-2E family transporter [Blastocatellia bacterium]|nr:AI-2E family transporter [Blastocatellia bacterium]HMV85423.1 AI-2E family transporter [Blastocatellia bacterium]HMY72741.1 AI-2E family transporter [Blastocatellia bacterium]HMZ16451.1 AI-2E family transporter [Blastocatellia bacterium]HNG30578.1 AI-2E family transporter [Blastocatellia bacterium]